MQLNIRVTFEIFHHFCPQSNIYLKYRTKYYTYLEMKQATPRLERERERKKKRETEREREREREKERERERERESERE